MGALAAAVVLPVVTATFSTKQARETGRVRMAAIVLLTVAALVITWTGFTLADGVAKKSVITGEQKGTLPGPPDLAELLAAPNSFSHREPDGLSAG